MAAAEKLAEELTSAAPGARLAPARADAKEPLATRLVRGRARGSGGALSSELLCACVRLQNALCAAPPLRVLPVDVLRIADTFAAFVEAGSAIR